MTKDTANNGKRRFIGEHSAGERITKHMHGASGAALSYACFEGIFIDDLAEIIVVGKTRVWSFHTHKDM